MIALRLLGTTPADVGKFTFYVTLFERERWIMTPIDKSDICTLHAELIDAYIELTAREQQIIDADRTLVHLTEAVETIRDLGNLPEVRAIYQLDHAIESVVHRDPGTLSANCAIEALGTTISEGFKKFLTYMKELIIRIGVFFQRLIGQVDKKAKEVLTHLQFMNWDKKVSIIEKAKLLKLGLAERDLQEHLGKRINIDPNGMRFVQDMDKVLDAFAKVHHGVLSTSNSGSLVLEKEAAEFNDLTLKEASYDEATIKSIIVNYTQRTKDVGPIKAGLNSLANAMIRHTSVYPAFTKQMEIDIRLAFKTDTFIYSLTAKLHAIVSRCILGFYKCIDKKGDVVYEPEVVNDDPSHALPYAA